MVNPDVHVLESRTRDRVLRVVSQEGPVSIPALVERLGLTETAVRRHVDGLHADGLVESREATGPRRRGRPAKAWVLTERGHRSLVSDYPAPPGQLSYKGNGTSFSQNSFARYFAYSALAGGHLNADGECEVVRKLLPLRAGWSFRGLACSLRGRSLRGRFAARGVGFDAARG